MKIQQELLKIKEINPIQKLILGLIIDTPPVILKFAGGYDKTCGQIKKELGVTYKVAKTEIERLVELGYITSRKGRGWRITNITQKLKDLLK
jgi:DNA-binding MarR family transcriptional regulator